MHHAWTTFSCWVDAEKCSYTSSFLSDYKSPMNLFWNYIICKWKMATLGGGLLWFLYGWLLDKNFWISEEWRLSSSNRQVRLRYSRKMRYLVFFRKSAENGFYVLIAMSYNHSCGLELDIFVLDWDMMVKFFCPIGAHTKITRFPPPKVAILLFVM